MKILNSLTITADDRGSSNNPLGSSNFNNLSTSLLNDFIISGDTFQSYIDSNILNDIWYNGEALPFVVLPTAQNSAGLYITNSYVTINTSNITSTIFSYSGLTSGNLILNTSGNLSIDSKKGFTDFILNDNSSNIGSLLSINSGNTYWAKPGFTQTSYYDLYQDIGGFPNLRSFSATFSFSGATAIGGLRYAIPWGMSYTSSVVSGITSSAASGYYNIDVYHNLGNTYSIVNFFAYTSSQWQMLYPTIGLSGVTGTFSYYSYGNNIRISLTGSLPTTPIQVNIIG